MGVQFLKGERKGKMGVEELVHLLLLLLLLAPSFRVALCCSGLQSVSVLAREELNVAIDESCC